MCKFCNHWVACFQRAVRTSCLTKVTNNHTSQLVTLFTRVKLFWQSSKQNAKSTGYPHLNKLCVQKVLSFPFSNLCFLFIDFYESFNFLSLILRNSVCFSRFSSEIFHETLAQGRPKLIPLCIPYVWLLCFRGVTMSQSEMSRRASAVKEFT